MAASLTAAELAAARVAAARDDPAQRLELAAGNFECGLSPRGSWTRFARSELAFLRAEIARGVLGPPDGRRPGSPWWRAVNERLLRDTAEATLLVQGFPGGPSSPSVELWLGFVEEPSSASWYRAHNASIVAAYLEHESLAGSELLAERFVLNVALLRVLYAHALAAAPRLALGRLAPLGKMFGDPRGGTVGLFLSIKRVFPDRYPLTGVSVDDLLADERRFFRSVDYSDSPPRRCSSPAATSAARSCSSTGTGYSCGRRRRFATRWYPDAPRALVQSSHRLRLSQLPLGSDLS